MSTEAITIFLASAVLTMSAAKIFNKEIMKQRTSLPQDKYMSTLSELFNISNLSQPKLPSRHNDQKQTTVDIFNDRKETFLSIYSSSGLKSLRPMVIHVAGTKGKGSTVEYIASAFHSQGSKVGVFTSPHMHTARERIKIGRTLISKEEIIVLGQQSLLEFKTKAWAVFFDYFLAMALNYFGKQQSLDCLILETGIGGRFDTTNFINDPAAVVITSISLDHQSLLGETVEEIAWQKAGIIKQNSHVFTPASQTRGVLDVFRKQCDELQATLHTVPIDSQVASSLGLRLPYAVQLENACLAHAVINHLGASPAGMANFYWPCRMETFEVNQHQVILDGCHNGDSVRQFLQCLRTNHPSDELLIVFGAGMEKCLNDMISHVVVVADRILITQSRHFRALSEAQLKEKILLVDPSCQKMLDVNNWEEMAISSVHPGIESRLQIALDYAAQQSSKKVVIAVCGSLFVASEAREELFKLQPNLFRKDDWVTESDPL